MNIKKKNNEVIKMGKEIRSKTCDIGYEISSYKQKFKLKY
jgi:hypothetical protein